MYPTQQDITNRVLLIKQEIINLSVKYNNALIYGSDHKKCLENKISLLCFLNDIFCEFEVIDTDLTDDVYNEAKNCFSQTELDQLFDYVSTTFNIYFPQYTGGNS